MDEEGQLRWMLDRITLQDQRLLSALAVRKAPRWLDRSLRLATHAGSATFTVLFCLGLLALPQTRHLGLVAAMANLFSHLAVQALKHVVIRPRPSVLRPGLAALAHLPDRYSFPSGHACSAMALAVAITLVQPLAGIPALAVALAVGASRIYLRVHYVTDVVVGQLLGAITALGLAARLS